MINLETLVTPDQEIVLPPANLTIDLTDGMENVAIGLVSTERAQPLLPPPFKLANNGEPVTPLVVLAAECRGIAVTGGVPTPGTFVQIGLIVAPPDGTGEINIFTLWHYTTHLTLARALKNAGLNSQHVPTIAFDVTLVGKAISTRLTVPAPGQPPLLLAGAVREPSQPVTFNGNWWGKAGNRLLKLNSVVPAATFGDAELTLTTRASNPLGRLIGGETLNFAILQRFNAFPQVRTTVSVLAA
ncbi:MAG: hypothetical protein DYG89_36410 [Caldilinea sp. CFX5]|nr:hypothetical protein [Caldilinea sp. CFX5]